MTLFEKLKNTYLEKRKARNIQDVAALSTLLGEIETAAKAGRAGLDDLSVIAMVKKFIKNIDDTIKVAPSTKLSQERALYESFLPNQLSKEELTALIDGFIQGGVSSVGEAMKYLKANHSGTYDGGMASAIMKTRFVK